MSISKSSNYLDNHHKTPPATSGEALDEDSFFIDAIFDIPNEGKNKNQQINHNLPQIRLWCSSQCNSRKSDWNSANKTKNNKINDHLKPIQRKQYIS